MYTLGINASFHDSSACLVQDGKLIAAAEEERFTHIKHGKRPTPFSTYEIPFHAIDYCLKVAGIHLCEVDHITYSFNPDLLEIEHEQNISLPLEPDVYPHIKNIPYEHPLFLYAIKNAPYQLANSWPHYLEERFKGCGLQKEKW